MDLKCRHAFNHRHHQSCSNPYPLPLKSPAPPPRPNINNLILTPLPLPINNKIPPKTYTSNTSMIGPNPNLLAYRQPLLRPITNSNVSFLLFFPAVFSPRPITHPPNNPMLLTNSLHDPTLIVFGGNGREGVPGSIPRAYDSPSVIGFARLATECYAACADEDFWCSVGAAGGVKG